VYVTRLEREKSPKSLAGYTFPSSPNRPFPTVVGTPRRIRTSNEGRVVSTAKADHPKIRQLVTRSETRGGRFRHRGTCPGDLDHEGTLPIRGAGTSSIGAKSSRVDSLPIRNRPMPIPIAFNEGRSFRSSPARGRVGSGWSRAWHLLGAAMAPLPTFGEHADVPSREEKDAASKCDCLAVARRGGVRGILKTARL
jgi:hypothetical protein